MLSSVSRSVLPHSTRKFLRREKARLRRQVFGTGEAEKKIQELVADVFKKHLKVREKERAV